MTFLLTLALALQDETAKEEYSKIVRSIEQAKTLKIVFQGEAVPAGKKDRKVKYTGKVLLKEGNQASWSMSVPGGGVPLEITLLSDGEKSVFSPFKLEKLAPPEPASPRLRSTFNQALCKFGIFYSCSELMAEQKAPVLPRPSGFLDLDEAVELKMSESVNNTATLLYKIRRKGRSRVNDFELPAQTIGVKLWYETGTYRLLSRMLTFRTVDDQEVTLTETYSEFIIGGGIPDSAFKLR